MKVILGQINTTPRDFEGNVAQILMGVKKAEDEGAELIVFPELSIPGYLTRDMMYSRHFLDRNLTNLQNIVNYTVGLKPHVVVGYIDRNTKGVGKPFRNMAAVIHDGKIIATYQKQLLPFYDVFDEGRYFEPGTDLTVVEIGDQKWGIAICEDVWNDKSEDNYNYLANPLAAYRARGVHNIISLNSSPFIQSKPAVRTDMLRQSFNYGVGIYVNQIGGQDELIFDGHSQVIQNGKLLYQVETGLNTTYEVVEVSNKINPVVAHTNNSAQPRKVATGYEALYKMLVLGLRDYIYKNNFKKVVVGSSGGIDSALVLALACEAIGATNVTGIRMPSEWSSQHSLDDAIQLHKNLGCVDKFVKIDHETWLRHINESLMLEPKIIDVATIKGATHKSSKANPAYNPVADENIQARMRGTILMHFSNATGALLLTTGNKSEVAVGYCTLYGDMSGGLAVISDLYKMVVYGLARWINAKAGKDLIPKNILDKEPSAELAPNQIDKNSLLPYPILDVVLEQYIDNYVGDFDLFTKMAATASQVVYNWTTQENARKEYNRMIRLVDSNEFKRRQAAPGLKVTRVAFGSGRRLPITKKW